MSYIDYEDDETELPKGNDRKWICKEQLRKQYRRKYYYNHKDKMNEATRRWKKENPDRCRQQRKDYASKNRLFLNEKKKQWRHMKETQEATVSDK